MRYKFLGPVSVAEWKDEAVVCHMLSGDTYLFVDLAKCIFIFCFSKKNFSFDDVVECIQAKFMDIYDMENNIKEILESMVHKNLISLVQQ